MAAHHSQLPLTGYVSGHHVTHLKSGRNVVVLIGEGFENLERATAVSLSLQVGCLAFNIRLHKCNIDLLSPVTVTEQ